MPQIIPNLLILIFYLNYSKTHQIVRGGSTEKKIGKGLPNILIFILYREG